MEYVKGISLLNYLKSQPGKKLPENECIQIFKQILNGMSYLHGLNIIIKI
jgi:serine/threonine protein kinase